MKDYYMEVTVQYAVCVQADSVEAAKEQVRKQFYQDFGITLLDEEIKVIPE